jgi:predicted nucleotidyltransferase
MDTEKVLVLEKVKRYLNELNRRGIRVEKAYFYGSYARGNYHKDSDIDIVIISRDFQGGRFSDWQRIAPLTEDIDVRLEPIPYRPEDFTDSDPLAVEVMATGEEIKI